MDLLSLMREFLILLLVIFVGSIMLSMFQSNQLMAFQSSSDSKIPIRAYVITHPNLTDNVRFKSTKYLLEAIGFYEVVAVGYDLDSRSKVCSNKWAHKQAWREFLRDYIWPQIQYAAFFEDDIALNPAVNYTTANTHLNEFIAWMMKEEKDIGYLATCLEKEGDICGKCIHAYVLSFNKAKTLWYDLNDGMEHNIYCVTQFTSRIVLSRPKKLSICYSSKIKSVNPTKRDVFLSRTKRHKVDREKRTSTDHDGLLNLVLNELYKLYNKDNAYN